MSCPDWTSLAAHRREREGVEPQGWNEALAHFDASCPLCRKQALQADPTLLFRRLPAVPASRMTEAEERSEVEAVRQAVAAMRAASRLDSLETRKRTLWGWKRLAAAAVLALAALSMPADDVRRVRPEGGQAAIFREGLVAPDAMPARHVEASSPVIEGVDLPDARVYHMDGGEGLSVVMVVDESIDI